MDLDQQAHSYLDIKDIMKILSISRNTAYKLLQLPGFPYIVIGNRYRVPQKEFERFMSEHIGTNLLI